MGKGGSTWNLQWGSSELAHRRLQVRSSGEARSTMSGAAARPLEVFLAEAGARGRNVVRDGLLARARVGAAIGGGGVGEAEGKDKKSPDARGFPLAAVSERARAGA